MATETSTASEPRIEDAHPAIELRAASFTLPMLRLLQTGLDAIEAELLPRVEQAPEFFRHAPVVIDLTGLLDSEDPVDFPRLVGLMRGLDMLPVGVRGGSAVHRDAARAMELAILSEGSGRSRKRSRTTDLDPPDLGPAGSGTQSDRVNGHDPVWHQPQDQAIPTSAEQADQSKTSGRVKGPTSSEGTQVPAKPQAGPEGSVPASRLVDRPVRSGQRIYVAGGDLTVTASVSSGSELMADGNIHVYAPLRGRVIAGLKGNTKARIFCQALHAELVSVAGHYRVSENIPAHLKGQPVQVFLEREILRIEPL